jgi:hypothetical protein
MHQNTMKRQLLRTGLLVLVAATVALMPATALAQAPGRDRQGQQDRPDRGPRGNFDPAQFQQRMMDNLRERLGVTDDAEWKIISERIQKVMEARRNVGFGGGMGMRFGGPPGAPGGDAAAGPGRRGFGAAPSPEADALRRAIESKASKEELKAAMAKYREAREANQAKLRQAQEDLRKVLTLEQEAIALSLGLVD